MEIPKAKVIIYVLTFIGYIWSGYGSNILTNLRDAVTAAESVFGDFYVKFEEVVQKFKNVNVLDTLDSSIDEHCIWSCPNGAIPVRDKYFKPHSNGCGPEGMKVNADYLPFSEMTECCNGHDICYSTCNSDKDKCDMVFKRCLYNICDGITSPELANKGCKAAAKMLYTATTALGCKFYQDAQRQSCYCPVPKRKKYPAGEL